MRNVWCGCHISHMDSIWAHHMLMWTIHITPEIHIIKLIPCYVQNLTCFYFKMMACPSTRGGRREGVGVYQGVSKHPHGPANYIYIYIWGRDRWQHPLFLSLLWIFIFIFIKISIFLHTNTYSQYKLCLGKKQIQYIPSFLFACQIYLIHID